MITKVTKILLLSPPPAPELTLVVSPVKSPSQPQLQFSASTRECPTYARELLLTLQAVTARDWGLSLRDISKNAIWIYMWYHASNTRYDPATVFLTSSPTWLLLIMPKVHWPSFCSSETSHLILSHSHCIHCFLCPERSLPKQTIAWLVLFHHSARLNCNFLREDVPRSHSLPHYPFTAHCI